MDFFLRCDGCHDVEIANAVGVAGCAPFREIGETVLEEVRFKVLEEVGELEAVYCVCRELWGGWVVRYWYASSC